MSNAPNTSYRARRYRVVQLGMLGCHNSFEVRLGDSSNWGSRLHR